MGRWSSNVQCVYAASVGNSHYGAGDRVKRVKIGNNNHLQFKFRE